VKRAGAMGGPVDGRPRWSRMAFTGPVIRGHHTDREMPTWTRALVVQPCVRRALDLTSCVWCPRIPVQPGVGSPEGLHALAASPPDRGRRWPPLTSGALA
jgi:hypothetical protein